MLLVGAEHVMHEEEGGKKASDLQSDEPEGHRQWLTKEGLPTFTTFTFVKQTNPETTKTLYKLKML